MFNKSQIATFFLFLLIFTNNAIGRTRILPMDPFFERYEKADLIIMGTVESVVPANFSLPDFSKDSVDYYKIASFKVSKVWKGKFDSNELLNFIFLGPGIVTVDSQQGKHAAINARKSGQLNDQYILYLRKINGRLLAANLFGFFIFSTEKPEMSEEFKSLSAISAKKPRSEIIPLLSKRDQAYYKKQEVDLHAK